MDSENHRPHLSRHRRKRISSPSPSRRYRRSSHSLMTVVLAPRSLRASATSKNRLIASQISFQVQPVSSTSASPTWSCISTTSRQRHALARRFPFRDRCRKCYRALPSRRRHLHRRTAQGKLELHLNSGTTHEFQRENPDQYSVTASNAATGPSNSTTLDTTKSGPQQSRTLAYHLWHDRGRAGATRASNSTSAWPSRSHASPSR